jgi:ABC-type dipeptide/oligopeptide/nickel transport system permease component
LPQSSVYDYLKALFTKRTLGLSDFDYPQTVQHFVLAAFPYSLYKFLPILAISLCTIGAFLLFSASKKEMNSNFSELSRFLRMSKDKTARQARLAALPGQVLFWSFFAPIIFAALLLVEAEFELPGLGSTIKTALLNNDLSLLYGSSICAFAFISSLNILFFI